MEKPARDAVFTRSPPLPPLARDILSSTSSAASIAAMMLMSMHLVVIVKMHIIVIIINIINTIFITTLHHPKWDHHLLHPATLLLIPALLQKISTFARIEGGHWTNYFQGHKLRKHYLCVKMFLTVVVESD